MDVTAQLSRVLLLLEQFCLKFNEQKENTTTRYADESEQNKIKDGFGPDVPPNLTSNERARWKSIAKIFKQTIGSSLFSVFSGDEKKNKSNTDVVDVRLVEISKKSLKDLKQGGDSAGSSWFSSLFKGIGAVVGIAALGTAIYYIIKSIGSMPSVDTNTILLVAGGILAFVGILYGLTKIGWGTLLKGLIALGGIAAILNFLIAPAMVLLSSVNWEDALGGVIAAGLAITGLAVLAQGIGKIVTTGRGALGMLAGLASIAAIAALIQYLIAPAMMEISKVQWDSALAGIEIAGIAITALAVLAGVIGALIVGSGGLGALAAGAGLLALTGLAWVMGYTADNLLKFNDVDADKLLKCAPAILALNLAMASGIFAAGSNLLSTVLNLGSKDPVKYYARFANEINAVNLQSVANSINILNKALGVKINNKGIFDFDYPTYYSKFSNGINAVNLQSVANSIASLHDSLSMSIKSEPIKEYIENYTKLLSVLSNPDIFKGFNVKAVLDSIKTLSSSFTDILKGFNIDIVLDSIKTLNSSITNLFTETTSLLSNVAASFNKINGIDLTPINTKVNDLVSNLRNNFRDPIDIKLNIDSQLNTMLSNLHEKETVILTKQLDQLINNGRKLDLIANNTSNSNSFNQGSNNSNSFESITTTKSSTKSSFLENLNLKTYETPIQK